MNRTISEPAWAASAQTIGVDIACLKAVAAVESDGSGFLPPPSEKPKVLFEGHIFHRHTNGRFDATAPTLSYPHWDKSKYTGSLEGEWKRLNAAMALDHDAALMSASWGAFQLMGFNFGACGFLTVLDFVKAQEAGAEEQLASFVQFIDRAPYRNALLKRDWAGFANVYNGPGYAKNHYDTRLSAAYLQHGGQPGTSA